MIEPIPKIKKVKLPTKTRMGERLDDLARELCKVLAGYRCERCGTPWNGLNGRATNLEWAHIERRNRHAIRWDMMNCLALCNFRANNCHYWFDNNRIVASKWLECEYPDKHRWLLEEINGVPRAQMIFTDKVPEMLVLEDILKIHLKEAKAEFDNAKAHGA